jgi:hypothetical protein
MDKILFIDNDKIFENWASKTYEYKINSIKRSELFDYVNIDNLNSLNKNYNMKIFGWNATYISKYYTNKYTFYSKKIKNLEISDQIKTMLISHLGHTNKYLVVQDLHDHDYENGINGLIQYLKKYNFKGIITPYREATKICQIMKEVPNLKIIHMPHHIDENNFKDYKLKKTIDIFLFGNISPTVYPFRNRLSKLLENNKDKFNVEIWKPIRNYFRFNPNTSNDKLSKIMNRSWITICTSSKYNMLLGKYFETSMSGSVVCGNMPCDGLKIWNDNFISLCENDSDEVILQKLMEILKDKDKLKNYTNTMTKKMEYYNLSNFSTHLYEKLHLQD